MGGSAKIKLSYCLLSRVFGNRFSKDLGPRLVAIFSSSRGSEATSKAIGIKYTYDEGSESNAYPPPKFSDFGAPVGGIREGKPHTLHPPSAKAYGVGGLVPPRGWMVVGYSTPSAWGSRPLRR